MRRVISFALSLVIMLALIAVIPVTVSAETASAPSTALSFYGASLTLEDNIAANYNVYSSLFTQSGYSNPYVVFEFNGKTTTVDTYRVSGNMYVFDFKDIAPNQMKDTIKATLYATYNGTEYSAAAPDFSVAQYCYGMLSVATGKEYAELRTLLVDLLQYGTASQKYTNYKLDNLASAELTADQRAMGTSTTPSTGSALDTEFAVVPNASVNWYGAALVLDDSIVIRLVIHAESVDGLVAKIVSDGDDEWTIDSSKFKSVGSGYYYIDFDGLDASQMRDIVYATVYNGDTAVSNTLSYSIETYAYLNQDSGNTNLKNLLVAMMRYGDSAYNYITEDPVEPEEDPDAGWSDWWTPEY